MLGNLIKRKIDSDKLANIFVNSILDVTENGFVDISEMIKEDNAFTSVPEVHQNHCDNFLLIVVVGNLTYLDEHFDAQDAADMRRMIIDKFASIYEVTYRVFEDWLTQTERFISSVNHPSKNMLYGMSKAVFHKFDLNNYQEDYFKEMKTPNPLFLKRMDEVMTHFLWDWDQFFKKHRFNLN
jgi:hypothetical protein